MQTKLQTPQRIFDSEHLVIKGSYFRVHLHPKRFPQAHVADWQRRILLDAEAYVIVNKPWGVQVIHRVDNVKESVVACVTRVRNRSSPLTLSLTASGKTRLCSAA
jgi:23S rRNA-/tRNA-specific pseudouridylate synthase